MPAPFYVAVQQPLQMPTPPSLDLWLTDNAKGSAMCVLVGYYLGTDSGCVLSKGEPLPIFIKTKTEQFIIMWLVDIWFYNLTLLNYITGSVSQYILIPACHNNV